MRNALLLATLAALVPTVAAAEPGASAGSHGAGYGVGIRIGGYGFRRAGDTSNEGWTQCRMNGAGVFANHTVRGPLFLEAGLDAYSTAGQPDPKDLPIDRQSALLSIAAGVRASWGSHLSGYAQLGTGIEMTRVAVPYGEGTIRDNKLLPDGFFGVGADLRLGKSTYIGAMMRTLVMGNFDYDPARLQMSNPWVSQPKPGDVFEASPGLAAQGQFYLRRDL